MYFFSPTKGRLSLNEVYQDAIGFIDEDPRAKYKVIIGSDSQTRTGDTCFVTAIIVHRIGKGARYYYRKKSHRRMSSLRQRIFFETALSLEVADQVSQMLVANGHAELDVEIHLDVGPNGESRELIREVVGMVAGSGFGAKIKPESCGASNVADKHTR